MPWVKGQSGNPSGRPKAAPPPSGPSLYDIHAPKLRERGYYVHPIGPGTKKPQHYVPSENKYLDMTGWTHPARPMETSPQPGAGIGLRTGEQPDADGTFVVAIDWDNDKAFLDAMEDENKIWSPVQKVGKRGGTTLYRSRRPIPSRDFKINGRIAVQVLAEGKQTVLPPTMHPETGKPYWYGDDRATLDGCRASELPLLPDDYIERIEAILRPLGYEPQPEKPKSNGHDHSHDNENPFKQLNDAALWRPDMWVRDLGLYACRRCRGPNNYEAVSDWRPSSTPGKKLEERDRNLKISPRGIKDFGNGETFSPIDLVMRARNCSRADAMGWLQERVLARGPEVDFDVLKNAEPAGSKQEKGSDDAKPQKERKVRFRLTPYSEMKPGLDQNYLVDELIPSKGIMVVWSPPKNFKSFVMLSIGLHIAMGWKFCGRAVQQGLVLYCAFEGGHLFSNRIEAQRRHYGFDAAFEPPMPTLKGMANLIADHKAMVEDFKHELQTKFGGAKPVAVVLDTLNRSFVGSESKDTDMAAYVRAAVAIRDAFDCVVIIIHRTGWDESRNRGHSSLPAAVDAELSLLRDGEFATLKVEAMRDGVEGTEVVLRAQSINIGSDPNGKERTSLVMVPVDAEDAPLKAGRPKGQEWPRSLKIFQRVVSDTMREVGFDFQITNGPKVRAVDVKYVRTQFLKTHTAENDEARRKAWTRALETAQQRGLIEVRNEDKRTIIWFSAQADEAMQFGND